MSAFACAEAVFGLETFLMEADHNSLQNAGKQPVNIGVLEACLIGLVAAAGAVTLKNGVGLLGSWRISIASEHVWLLPFIGLAGGLLAGLLVKYIVPEASGSGIPQTKAALYGTPLPLNLKTAAVKLMGCIASLGAGMALGREGPTVQVSAALSANLTGLVRTSPAHRIQLIAAGAGAGLAAAFNAPLAGVLFVLEELLKNMSGLAVGTTVVACFVASVSSRLVGVHSLDVNFSTLVPKATFSPEDIPFFLALGVVAGGFGAVFNKSVIGALSLNRDVLKLSMPISCGLAGMLSGLLVMNMPPVFWNYAGLREMLVQHPEPLYTVVLALSLQFVLTILAYGSGAPGGLFAPSLTMGACLGHVVALCEQNLLGSGDVGTFAIVGMGALFCAVARVPMTAVVIIFEMTTDFNVVLPLMISCVIAYLVAEKLDPGSLYDQLLHFAGIDLEHTSDADVKRQLKVGRFMQKEVETLKRDSTLAEVLEIFNKSRHQGFPVVDENQRVVGIVAKPDLIEAAKRNLPPETPVSSFMTPNPLTVHIEESLTGVLYLMDKYKVSRLPVVERGKLSGIITRSDVLSAETQAIGIRSTSGSKSYVIYQTRSAEAGQGRLLLAVPDPDSAAALIKMAAAIARSKDYELEILHVITVPRDKSPSETRVAALPARKIAHEAENIAEELKLPIHTNIRVAHHIGEAMAETIADRNIDLFVMRWSYKRTEEDSQEILQTVLEASDCPILLLGQQEKISPNSRFLVPVGQLYHHKLSVQIAEQLCLENGNESKLRICAVRGQGQNESQESLEPLHQELSGKLNGKVEKLDMIAGSITRLLLTVDRLKSCDVMVMGVSRKSLSSLIQQSSFVKTLNRMKDCSLIITAD